MHVTGGRGGVGAGATCKQLLPPQTLTVWVPQDMCTLHKFVIGSFPIIKYSIIISSFN